VKYAVRKAQNVSKMCAVCGRENPLSLNARFYELESDELLGVFAPRDEHQGYPGRMHGGIASAAIDETIGRAINVIDPDAWGVTVSLSVRFRKPVPLDREMHAIARITSDSTRLFEGTGEILLEDGTVAVEASGTYLKLPIDRIAEGDFGEQWFADEREAPAEVELPE
jgi:acyl-coenzyme A thioesterase PaaI-like protein